MKGQETVGTNTAAVKGHTEASEREDGALHVHLGWTRDTWERSGRERRRAGTGLQTCGEGGDGMEKQIQRPNSLKEKI